MFNRSFSSRDRAPIDYRRRSVECVERIKKQHYLIIIESGNEHERGLENAMYSEGALQRICDQADYIQDFFDYAALNLEAIALGHPFVEGNKRTAFVMTGLILSENGYDLPDDDKTFEFVRKVAMGIYTREEIADWLRSNSIKSL